MGSLLLTPQENESLFTFLGKKCVVSGRDPRLHPLPDVTSRAREVGVGKKAGAARGGSGCRPGLQPAGSLGTGSAGRGRRTPPPEAAREHGKCHLRRPVLEPCLAGPGSAPLLLVQTLLSGHKGILFLHELLDLKNRASVLALASPPTA